MADSPTYVIYHDPCHHERCGYPLARCVPHKEPDSALGEEVEGVEVSSYLPGWLVAGGDLPSL